MRTRGVPLLLCCPAGPPCAPSSPPRLHSAGAVRFRAGSARIPRLGGGGSAAPPRPAHVSGLAVQRPSPLAIAVAKVDGLATQAVCPAALSCPWPRPAAIAPGAAGRQSPHGQCAAQAGCCTAGPPLCPAAAPAAAQRMHRSLSAAGAALPPQPFVLRAPEHLLPLFLPHPARNICCNIFP